MANDETKANELYNSMVDGVYSLSRDQLYDLQNIVDNAVNKLEIKRMIDLQDKAINAIRDYFHAGGYLCSKKEDFFEIEEQPEDDDDFYHIHLK